MKVNFLSQPFLLHVISTDLLYVSDTRIRRFENFGKYKFIKLSKNFVFHIVMSNEIFIQDEYMRITI